MIGFVDDCTQRVNMFESIAPSANELLNCLAHDAQLWNDLLWVSGGALETSKCSYHLIQTDWTPDGQPFLKGGIESTPIRIQHQDEEVPIYQKSSYDTHKTLGCHINPSYTRTQT